MSRRHRAAAAAMILASTVALAGCADNSFDQGAGTFADGINATAGNVSLRNMLIVADQSGSGRLVGALATPSGKDTVTSIKGNALKADGSDGAPLTISGVSDLAVQQGKLTNLYDPATPPITVTGSDLKPGLGAHLVFTFGSGTTKDVTVTVVDASNPQYAGVPVAAAAAAGSATPSASATPAATPATPVPAMPAASPSPTPAR